MWRSGMLPLRMLAALLLSFLPYGAELTCTPALNPLIMDAPKIVEMGTELSANCSTTKEEFEEMSLCLGETCCKNPPNQTVVFCVAPVSDFEMKAACKIKLNNTFECSTEHEITVYNAPELRSNATQYISVVKGGNATLLCDVEGSPPPDYQWTVDEQPLLETTNRLELHQINSSSTYSCTATNLLGNITVQVHVNVEEETTNAAPGTMPTTEASALENCGLTLTPAKAYVKYGDSASIDCSTTSKDVAKMAWEAAVGNSSETPPTVTWRVEKLQDFTVAPLCYVTLDNDSQCNLRSQLILYKLPDLVVASAVAGGSMREGEEHQLQCDIYSVAPANKVLVKWYKNNETVFTDDPKSSGVTPDPECLRRPIVGLCNLSSVYTFSAKKSDDGSVFTCKAEFQFGREGPAEPPSMSSEPLTADVHYKPTIKNCPASYAGKENFRLRDLPCTPSGNPPPDINWYHNNALIDSSKPLDRNESGLYRVTVNNSMDQVYMDVNITVEYLPSFSCQIPYEVKANDTPKTFCKPEGLPPPNISWFKNGKEIFPQRWNKDESGNYLLKASNKHGTVEHMFYLDILYPPEFTEPGTTKEFTADSNVVLVWKADGNPEPQIKCSYPVAENVQEATEGRQKIITIKGATSTNVGHYICVATNKFGNGTRTATLIKKDKTHDLAEYWWVCLLVLLLLAVLVYIWYICYYRKKQGRYNFVAINDSSIPLQSNSTVENGKSKI